MSVRTPDYIELNSRMTGNYFTLMSVRTPDYIEPNNRMTGDLLVRENLERTGSDLTDKLSRIFLRD